jgi:hypothetical protein
MQLVTAIAFTFLFSLHAFADDDDLWKWTADLEWIKNVWTIESPAFARNGNATDPLSSTNLVFQLYYHKWEECNSSVSASADSASSQDPKLCGIDLETSRISARCSLFDDGQIGEKPNPEPWPKSLWHPCGGRWVIAAKDARCKGLNLTEKARGVRGCQYDGRREEDQSERPWIRWRIVTFDEGPVPIINGSKDASKRFQGMTVEIVNGQRLVYNFSYSLHVLIG